MKHLIKHVMPSMALAAACAHAAAGAATDTALLAAGQAERPALTATLEKLVTMESGSRDAAGVAALSALLERELAALGMAVQRDAAGTVRATLAGQGSQRILLLAHMDTVYPRGALAKAPFRIVGERAYGPGIADDKSGIAVILHTVKLLKARGFDGYGSLSVLFNVDEEVGSAASHPLITAAAREADYVLSFEPNLAGTEGFTLGTSGVGAVQATVKGKPAHAGVNPDAGVNALVEAADFVARTAALDDKAQGLRFNWTSVQAGSGSNNVIPDSAKLSADVRYASNEQFDALRPVLEQRARQVKLPGAQVDVTLQRGRPAFNADAGSRALIDTAVALYAEAGGKLVVAPRIGGGTDAAYAALAGKPVLEGLGLPGAGMHGSADEYVELDAIPRRLYLAARLVMALSARPAP